MQRPGSFVQISGTRSMSNCRNTFLLFSCIGLGNLAGAQNLVPNPSFEVLDSCPSNDSEIEAASPWRTFRGSVDLYNACDTLSYVGVPYNGMGFQYAYEGDGYAGLISYLDGDTLHRELLGAELLAPLSPGVPVFISFRMAVGGWGLFAPRLSSSGVGVFFSTTAFLQSNNGSPLPNWTAISYDVAPTDTAAWLLVSGEFIPDSAYTQIVIGNPLNRSQLEVIVLDSTTGVIDDAYVFVDAVCVTTTPGSCPLTMGMVDRRRVDFPAIEPNPCTDRLVLECTTASEGLDHYEVYDTRGTLVQKADVIRFNSQTIINTSILPAGVFSLVAYCKGVPVARKSFVHLNP